MQNVSISIVGENTDFVVYEDSDVDKYLELIAGEERRNQVKYSELIFVAGLDCNWGGAVFWYQILSLPGAPGLPTNNC